MKLDFTKCSACKHLKHVGRVCGVRDPNNPINPVPCECDDARARKDDRRKVGGYHLIPWRAIKALASIYEYGAKKYAAHSWRSLPPDPETGATAADRYFDAMMRHFTDFKNGEWLDPESGKPHLAHALWGAVAVFELAMDEVEKKKE